MKQKINKNKLDNVSGGKIILKIEGDEVDKIVINNNNDNPDSEPQGIKPMY